MSARLKFDPRPMAPEFAFQSQAAALPLLRPAVSERSAGQRCRQRRESAERAEAREREIRTARILGKVSLALAGVAADQGWHQGGAA